jgi:lysophospholipid acyltransferase (LPLAT)-like uncharacterized protein
MDNCSGYRAAVSVERKGRITAALYGKVGAASIVVTSDKPKAIARIQIKPSVRIEVVDE